ncbi:four-carbon acid sugar kinase family protein [uncultured Algibacter sp.]|uniref:four-carbon acid sugar kinase family protein n=1 Tax=uncultured Algibacter sp. TaxID=298659 RepID=UPI00261A22F6|nr:four-carbon acid sugar kinase family protein [uncultured Algibacter sp.]
MSISLLNIAKRLPVEDTSNYRGMNHNLFKQLNRTCIVIDDDPTGNQTVYDIPLLTNWDKETILNEFKKETPVFFILTNSRSLSEKQSSEIFRVISENVGEASKTTNRKFTIISRSDSTLRGHFSEIEVIKQTISIQESITLFIPVMFEGGRVSVNDTHYISDSEHLTPVNETPFAEDHTFRYSNANLKAYIEEKTKGKIKASEVYSFSINDVRTLDVKLLSKQLIALKPNQYCIVNALNYTDLDKFSQAILLAEKSGKTMFFRTSSSFVPSYIGQKPKGLLNSKNLLDTNNSSGGLTVVGSYVKKSSIQLNSALNHFEKECIVEVNVEIILSKQSSNYIASLISKIDKLLIQGKDAIIFTSRKIISGKDTTSNINIASKISNTLVALVKGIQVCPKYLIAKGGITSHDLATKGLGMKQSKVLGQIESGIPVWSMGKETKFPELPYIVFPGNVGNENSLLTIIQKLK